MIVENLIQRLMQTVDDVPGLVADKCHLKSPRMLKAWTVDAGFMDGPNGFNGPNANFFVAVSLRRSEDVRPTSKLMLSAEKTVVGAGGGRKCKARRSRRGRKDHINQFVNRLEPFP